MAEKPGIAGVSVPSGTSPYRPVVVISRSFRGVLGHGAGGIRRANSAVCDRLYGWSANPVIRIR